MKGKNESNITTLDRGRACAALRLDNSCVCSNDEELTPRQVLEAYKRQPMIEKRFVQTKTVLEIAPVLLKNEGRIEALLILFFIALFVQSLIEAELTDLQREVLRLFGVPEACYCRGR